MRVLSFDIGIHNLAFCLLETTQGVAGAVIEDWDVIDLKKDRNVKHTFTDIAESLMHELHDRFVDDNYDLVVIENQPVQKNPTMKSIQMIVFTYFMVLRHQRNPDCRIALVSASNKLKVREKPEGLDSISAASKYAITKKKGIALAEHYLANVLTRVNADTIAVFHKHKKRDDLADSLLLAVHALEKAE